MWIHLVPVVLGGGVRLFDGLAPEETHLEVSNVLGASASATLLRYGIVK